MWSFKPITVRKLRCFSQTNLFTALLYSVNRELGDFFYVNREIPVLFFVKRDQYTPLYHPQNYGNVACRLRFADLVINTVIFKGFSGIFMQERLSLRYVKRTFVYL